MTVRFPAAVPEIPAADLGRAASYYVDTLGFTLDWENDEDGIVGISRGDCRLFLTDHAFREPYGNTAPLVVWVNLESKADVDDLFAEWRTAKAKIVSKPEDKPSS
jgi:catechol 2,3-dioxygenase-like lactoylglutathione lyase family enzyme